jgi:hypothetical protein
MPDFVIEDDADLLEALDYLLRRKAGSEPLPEVPARPVGIRARRRTGRRSVSRHLSPA